MSECRRGHAGECPALGSRPALCKLLQRVLVVLRDSVCHEAQAGEVHNTGAQVRSAVPASAPPDCCGDWLPIGRAAC